MPLFWGYGAYAPWQQYKTGELRQSVGYRGVTVEFQRKQAKALQQFFRELKTQQVAEGRQ